MIQNCSISFCGGNGVDGVESEVGTSSYLAFKNNIVHDLNNNGLILKDQFTNVLVSNNNISNIGLIPGTGYPKNIATHTGVYIGYGAINNTNTTIDYNNITNVGYTAIDFWGTNIRVQNNYVNSFCLEREDGGGIYTYDESDNDIRNCSILNNIVLNGPGNLGGTLSGYGHDVHGIYCDGHSNGISVQGNTVANCSHSGYYENGNSDGVITDNTFYNNKTQIYLNCIFNGNAMKNVQLRRNIAFSKTADQQSLLYIGYYELTSTASLDDNYYVRPIDDSKVITNWIYPSKEVEYTIDQWQAHSGQDSNSHNSPVAITDPNKIRFEYNASKTNKVINLDGNYIDIKGTKYSENITLLPYTSSILMIDPDPTVPSPLPVFVSSSIENVDPSVINVVYDVSLANIVPAASAFIVKVNSSTRSVNNVAISGSSVLLTLATPVVYGDVVSLSYTKPSSNPLQTTGGGQAASITAKAMINRVNPLPVPTYVSSSVENSAPSVINVVYDVSLANIVPAASAFTVKVNSSTRSVNNVAISGSSVLLTLATPVVYGDVISLSYTKPSSNPLQTTGGGQAASITAKAVTIRLIQCLFQLMSAPVLKMRLLLL